MIMLISIFDDEDWGLIIYDEVHLLPAPVFKDSITSGRRRLGLTATLIREDGREGDVFSLAEKYMTRRKQFSTCECAGHEVRTPMPQEWIKNRPIRNGT